MSKKQVKSDKELLQDALVPVEEQPYEIPSHWKWVRMNYIIDVRDGTHDTPKYVTEGYPLITSKNLKSGEIDFSNVNYISEEDHNNISKRSYVDENDILFAMIGTIGNACIIKDKDKEFSIKNVALFKQKSNLICMMYLYYYLRSDLFLTPLLKSAKGSTQKFVPLGTLRSYPVPLPPLDEQKQIADKIERMLDKINQSKQLIQEVKQTFELRRAAILEKAFSGELTKKWREENIDNYNPISLYQSIYQERVSVVESKRELQEINEMYSEVDINSCIDQNGWLRLKMNMFCHNINCGGTPTGEITNEGEVPFLKVYNIVNNKIDFEYKPQFIPNSINKSKLKKSILVPNDVIMNIVGPPLKKIAMIPDSYEEWNMNQAIVRFRSLSVVDPKFVYYGLQYDETLKEVMNATKGVVGQANISISQSRNLIMPIPSLEEQYQIVRLVEDLINKEDQSLETLDSLNNQINTLENSILAQAYKGKIK